MDLKIGFFGTHEKRSVSLRFLKGEFTEGYIPTIEDEFSKVIEINNRAISVSIIETAGQDDFKEMRYSYYSQVHGMILFFNVLNIMELSDLESIVTDALECCDNCLYYAIGAIKTIRIGRARKKYLSNSTKEKIAESFKCPVFELDVKTGENIDLIIETVVKQIIQKKPNEVIQDIDISDIISSQKKIDESEVDKGEWNIGIYGKDDSKIDKLGEKIIVGDTKDYKFGSAFGNKYFRILEAGSMIAPINLLFEYNFSNVYSFFASLKGIIIMIDIRDDESFNDAASFAKTCIETNSEVCILFAVYNANSGLGSFVDNFEKYEKLEKQFNAKVFEISIETCANVEEMIYYITNKIVQKKKKNKRSQSQRRKHHKTKNPIKAK